MLPQGSREGRTGERDKVTHNAIAPEDSADIIKSSGAGWAFRVVISWGREVMPFFKKIYLFILLLILFYFIFGHAGS